MGIASIATRNVGSFGPVKANTRPVVSLERQLDAAEYNRIADAVIELQEAVGTNADPDPESLEGRVDVLEYDVGSAQSVASSAASAAATAQATANTATTAAATAQATANTATTASAAAQTTASTATTAAATAQATADDAATAAAAAQATANTATTGVATLTAQVALLAPLLLPQKSYADSITLQLSDKHYLVYMTKATAQSVTVPPNSSVPFDVGTVINVCRWGAGALTFVKGSGVEVRSDGNSLTAGNQYTITTLIKKATDEWLLSGSLG